MCIFITNLLLDKKFTSRQLFLFLNNYGFIDFLNGKHYYLMSNFSFTFLCTHFKQQQPTYYLYIIAYTYIFTCRFDELYHL